MSRYCNILLPFLPLALFCLSCPAYPQTRVVLRIEITSKRSGLGGRRDVARKLDGAGKGEPDSTDLVIHREGDAYYLDDKDAKIVDASLIAVLVKALTAPANPDISLDGLGVTPTWLKANASSVAHHLAETRVVNGHPVHEAMLESSFADPATMEKVVPRLFDNRYYFCFDCRHYLQSVVVHVTFDNFTSLEARSSSQFPYMLPWRLTGNPTPASAFNADISRAIAALMPENSSNRSRLSGENLAMELGRSVLMDVEHQAQLLEVESKTGGTLAALRSRYTVEQASIGDYGDPALRKPERTEPEGSALSLRLQPPELPHVFQDEVVLSYVNGNVVGTDEFLQEAPPFEKLVLSVPWLVRYKQENPRVQLRLAFFHNASLSDDALEVFAADMREVGRDNLLPKVNAEKERIALFIAGNGAEESDWLVFPDRRMILWRYWQTPIYGKPSLLKFELANFDAKPCARLKNNFLHCVGAEISPEGILRH
jgi:hypothetical protein